ncbi:MAG: hypothetical protein EKK30_05170 [Hyphomicrobium sp.]|nr:MAG: hypothetical protein EKK30_05170 [Hyphomicrobium sp.]
MPRTAVPRSVPIVFRSPPRVWGIRLTKFALVAFGQSPFVVTVPIGAIVDLTNTNTVLVGAPIGKIGKATEPIELAPKPVIASATALRRVDAFVVRVGCIVNPDR